MIRRLHLRKTRNRYLYLASMTEEFWKADRVREVDLGLRTNNLACACFQVQSASPFQPDSGPRDIMTYENRVMKIAMHTWNAEGFGAVIHWAFCERCQTFYYQSRVLMPHFELCY